MSLEKWKVYKHTTPSGKVYIGITHQKPEYRWGKEGNGYKSNNHFSNAIKKYGWENIKHEIIAEVTTQSQAEAIEKNLINYYKSYDSGYGYNKALGGHALSPESRRKIGETRKERGITSWTLGKHLSETTKEKISKANRGRHYTLSYEAREHIAAAKCGERNPNFGKKLSSECKKKLVEANQKPVYQITKEGKRFFCSAKEAENKTGVACYNITRVCKGQRKTAGGFAWQYAIAGSTQGPLVEK